jgi:hypothetical protein
MELNPVEEMIASLPGWIRALAGLGLGGAAALLVAVTRPRSEPPAPRRPVRQWPQRDWPERRR